MKAGVKSARGRRVNQPKPMPHDDEQEDDPMRLSQSIVRKVMDIKNAWLRCHRSACKRGRACRGRNVPCAGEMPRRKQRGNPEKRQRDDARSRAIFQRMLHERLAKIEERDVAARDEKNLSLKSTRKRKQDRR